MNIVNKILRHRSAIVLTLALLMPGAATAAQVIIVNADQANVGLNDPTPATPEGGNNGTTLGQQRMNLMQHVADIWGAKLQSTVPIRVQVSFTDNHQCQQNPGDFVYLATSGPTAYYTAVDPPYPPHPIVYPVALRNALVGTVADPSTPELYIQVNPKMDSVPNCIAGYDGYWYGTDPDIASPDSPKQFPILTLLLHEMAHGLGFVENANLSNGSAFPPYRYAYNTLLYDTQIGKFWSDMSDSERMASATNDPNLVWTGEHTEAVQDKFLRPPLRVRSNASVQPGEVLQAYFGKLLPRSGLSAQARLVSPAEACTPLSNGAQLQGRIALIKRGTCAFDIKAKHAQQAGAIGALILNNRAETPSDPLPVMGGSDFTVRLPSASVNYQAGLNLISAVSNTPSTVVTVEPIPGAQNMATQSGYVRMHAPATLAPLSSVSHWSSDSATPLLMQSEINQASFDRTDMTEALLQDLGWELERIFKDGFDGGD